MAAGRINWLVVIGFWLVLAAALLVRAELQVASVPLYGDTDDAMRIVTATDLLNGQAWQDTIEHRDNAPFGASMHWSRLVDAPIAGLIAVFRPLAGPAAPDWAAKVWPLVLLLPLLCLSVVLSRRFAGAEGDLPGMVLPVLAMPVFIEFLPGRVDHHNVQILLTLVLVVGTLIGRKSLEGAVIAGLAAATSIAIGIETIAMVVVAIVVMSLYWVTDPAGARRPLLGFAAAFPLASLAHLVAASPPALYFTPACDALSFTYVSAAALVGGAMALAATVGGRLGAAWQRLLLIAGLGLAAGLVTLALSPACIGGPYSAVPPELAAAFFPEVKEAQNVLVRFAQDPALTLAYVGTSVFAVVVSGWAAATSCKEHRAEWLVLLAFALAGLIVTGLQIRGARFAGALAVPAGAWLIVSARRRYLTGGSVGRVAGLVASWLMFAGVLHFGVGSAIAGALGDPEYNAGLRKAADPVFAEGLGDSPHALCDSARTYSELAALPSGRVMAPIDSGAMILRYTDHSVVGTGYHRNSAGMRDTIHFFNSNERTAKAVARRRGLDYVAFCRLQPPRFERERATATSFTVTYEEGRSWAWLVPLSRPDDLMRIYRVDFAR